MVAIGALSLLIAARPISAPPVETLSRPVVARVRNQIQPLWHERVPDALARTMAELAKGGTMVTNYRLPVRLRANTDPWGAMAGLEFLGFQMAGQGGRENPAEIMLSLEAGELKGPMKVSGNLPTKSTFKSMPLTVHRGRISEAISAMIWHGEQSICSTAN